jgi:hypothetical protein
MFRLWTNLIGRLDGPLTFRLILQPTVAAFLAFHAGWKDAQEGRVPYGWVIFSDPANRRELLLEGWRTVAKVFVVAVIIDFVYQIMEFRWFYPEEAAIVAAILALLPYLVLRGPANRIVRRWRRSAGDSRQPNSADSRNDNRS